MAPACALPSSLPTDAPAALAIPVRYADVAVTATAAEFAGIYRGKQNHPPDMATVLDRAQSAGVQKVLLTGMSLGDVEVNLSLARTRPGQCAVTIGVHPYHAAEPEADDQYISNLSRAVNAALLESPKLIRAFGELGLDYDRLDRADKDIQIRTFKAQLDLFVEQKWDLPLFLHCRAAFEDFVDIITPYLPLLPRSGLVHSFVGTAAQMHKLVELGFDVSVNGFSFKAAESLLMVSEIPLAKLQIETDAPWGEVKDNDEIWKRYGVHYQSNEAKRKKKDKWEAACMVKDRNESCCIERVAFVVAGCQGRPVSVVAQAAGQNSMKMFWSEEVPALTP
jgi:TatD DNase family protein